MRRYALSFLLIYSFIFSLHAQQADFETLNRGPHFSEPVSEFVRNFGEGPADRPRTMALTAEQYMWDRTRGTWIHHHTYHRGYDQAGHLVGEEVRDASGNPMFRKLMSYSAAGNQQDAFIQTWSGVQWRPYSLTTARHNGRNQLTEQAYFRWVNDTRTLMQQSEYQYDLHGEMIEEIHRNRYDETLETVFHLKYSHSYDHNGKPVSTISLYRDGSEWVEYQRNLFAWEPSGFLETHTYQIWLRVGGQYKWVDQEKTDYRYDLRGRVVGKEIFRFDFSTWSAYQRLEYRHLGHGGFEEEGFSWDGSVWVPAFQRIEEYGGRGARLKYQYSTWNGFAWQPQAIDLLHQDFDEIDRLQMETTQVYDGGTFSVVNYEKWEYRDFFTFDQGNLIGAAVSIAATEEAPDIRIYPNPAKDRLYLSGNLSLDGPARVYLFDMKGQLVKTLSWEGMEASLSLDGLAPGMYLLKGRTSNHSWSQKFIKE